MNEMLVYTLIDASNAMKNLMPLVNNKLNSFVASLQNRRGQATQCLMSVSTFAMNLSNVQPMKPVAEFEPLELKATAFPMRNLKQAIGALENLIEKDGNTYPGHATMLLIITAGTPMPGLEFKAMQAFRDNNNFSKIIILAADSVSQEAFAPLGNVVFRNAAFSVSGMEAGIMGVFDELLKNNGENAKAQPTRTAPPAETNVPKVAPIPKQKLAIDAQNTAINDLKQKCDAFSKNNAELQAKLDNEARRCRELEVSLQKARAEEENARGTLKAKEDELTRKNTELKASRDEVAELKQKLAAGAVSGNKELEEARAQLKTLQEQLVKAQPYLERLKQEEERQKYQEAQRKAQEAQKQKETDQDFANLFGDLN